MELHYNKSNTLLEIELHETTTNNSEKKLYLVLYSEVKNNKEKLGIIKKEIFKEEFLFGGFKQFKIDISKDLFPFSYQGKKIDIHLVAEVKADKTLVDETLIKKEITFHETLKKDTSHTEEQNTLLPKTNYFKLFLSLSLKKQIIELIFISLGLILIFKQYTFPILGLEEISFLKRMEYISFFSVGAGIIFSRLFSLKLFKRHQLTRFYILKDDIKFLPGKKYKLNAILKGKTKINLNNLSLSIVAENIEKYIGHKGNIFSKTVTRHVLIKEDIPFIPKGGDISNYTNIEVDFGELYSSLNHPYMIQVPTLKFVTSKRQEKYYHKYVGLDLHVSVEISDSNNIINQQIRIPTKSCNIKDFQSYKSLM